MAENNVSCNSTTVLFKLETVARLSLNIYALTCKVREKMVTRMSVLQPC